MKLTKPLMWQRSHWAVVGMCVAGLASAFIVT
jgi:hypothetical protein